MFCGLHVGEGRKQRPESSITVAPGAMTNSLRPLASSSDGRIRGKERDEML